MVVAFFFILEGGGLNKTEGRTKYLTELWLNHEKIEITVWVMRSYISTKIQSSNGTILSPPLMT